MSGSIERADLKITPRIWTSVRGRIVLEFIVVDKRGRGEGRDAGKK